MDYAYQHSFTHIWNDFDGGFRDLTMAYPTENGVIGTIQWEGFREGVDDVRYVTTLIKAVEEAKGAGGQKADRAQATAAWMADIDPQGDLDVIRKQMIERILQLIE